MTEDRLEKAMRYLCDTVVGTLNIMGAWVPVLAVVITMGILQEAVATLETNGRLSTIPVAEIVPVAYLLGGVTLSTRLMMWVFRRKALQPIADNYYTTIVGIVLAGIGASGIILAFDKWFNMAPPIVVYTVGTALFVYAEWVVPRRKGSN